MKGGGQTVLSTYHYLHLLLCLFTYTLPFLRFISHYIYNISFERIEGILSIATRYVTFTSLWF